MASRTLPTAWRAGALRGLAHGRAGDEALVALGADQVLRIPIAAERVGALRAQLGRRVWVQLDSWRVQIEPPQETGHA